MIRDLIRRFSRSRRTGSIPNQGIDVDAARNIPPRPRGEESEEEEISIKKTFGNDEEELIRVKARELKVILPSQGEEENKVSLLPITKEDGTTILVNIHGISLRWILKFFDSDPIKRLRIMRPSLTTTELDFLLRKMTEPYKCSILELLLSNKETKCFVKEKADRFISHAWSYSISNIMETFQELLNDNGGEDLFVWFDLLIINQHKAAEVNGYPPSFWSTTFHQAIKDIGHTVAIMHPWNNPIPLTRSWCVWEIYGSTLSDSITVQVAIPPSQVADFRKDLLLEPRKMIEKITKIDIEKASAYQLADQVRILEAARNAPGGTYQVQESIVKNIRSWTIREAKRMVQDLQTKEAIFDDQMADALACAAILLEDQGQYDDAEPLSRQVLLIRKSLHPQGNLDVSSAMCNLALLLQSRGKFQEALELLKAAFQMEQEILSNSSDPEHAKTAGSLGRLLQQMGNYQEAETYYLLSMKILKENYGDEDERISQGMNNLGYFYEAQGRFDEAETYYSHVLKLRRNTFGELHFLTGAAYNNLGMLLYSSGKYSECESSHRSALSIWKKILGLYHPTVAGSMNNLGLVLKDSGQLSEAKEFFLNALDVYSKSSVGSHHPESATTFSNLANLEYSQGEYTNAEIHHLEALKIRKEYFGEVHEQVATSLNNLGVLYDDLGRYDESVDAYKAAIEIRKKIFGENHIDLAANYNNLGMVYQAQNKLDQASEMLQLAIDIWKSSLGERHPTIATGINNLAMLKKKQGKLDEAMTLYQDTLNLRKEILPKDHPDIAVSLNNLALLLVTKGDLNLAETMFLDAIEIWKASLGEESPSVAVGLTNLAQIYQKQNQFVKAELTHRNILRIRLKIFGESNPHQDIALTLTNLGIVLRVQGKFIESESKFRQGLEMNQKLLGENHLTVATNHYNLGRILQDQSKNAEAKVEYEKAMQIWITIFGVENHPNVLAAKKSITECLS